jgi:hypothetical protein
LTKKEIKKKISHLIKKMMSGERYCELACSDTIKGDLETMEVLIKYSLFDRGSLKKEIRDLKIRNGSLGGILDRNNGKDWDSPGYQRP